MRMRGLVAAVLAGLALVAATALPARAAREASATYVAGNDPVALAVAHWATGAEIDEVNCAPAPVAAGLGGACFAIEPGDASVRVRIADASGLPVSGSVGIIDAAGEVIGGARFCMRTEEPIPSGAVAVVVGVDSTIIGCGLGGGVGTAGTVVAFFS